MFDSRTRPCLLHQIKRCSAPCVGKISKQEYAGSVRDAERFLMGKSTDIQAKLAADMQAASEAMEFERAAALRDRIRAMTQRAERAGDQPARRDGGGYRGAAHGQRAGLRAGVLHPRRPELGQPRFLSPRRRRCGGGGGAGGVPRPVLRHQGTAAAGDPVEPDREPGPDGRSTDRQARPQGGVARAPARARRRNWWKARCATPAKASPARWRRRRRKAKLLRGLAEAFELDAPPRADRGLRQLPHPGRRTRSAR